MHLHDEAELWREATLRNFEFDDHERAIVDAAASALSRALTARDILDAEGLIVTDRFGQRREHPAAKLQRDFSLSWQKLVLQLGLDNAEATQDRFANRLRLGGR